MTNDMEKEEEEEEEKTKEEEGKAGGWGKRWGEGRSEMEGVGGRGEGSRLTRQDSWGHVLI